MNSCGKQDCEVYRIENFTPTPVDTTKHMGEFFTGDSYVCIFRGEKKYDIHYWEGKESTADETGCAAAFTVQLSDRFEENFNKKSVHHLELQGEETELFMSRFHPIKYLQGGVASGFKHYVPDEHVNKLYRVVGKRYPRIYSVPIEASQLNEGDVFVLDLGEKIFCWQGNAVNTYEKHAAINFCDDLRQCRHVRATVLFPRDGHNTDEFWAVLGGSEADVQPAKEETE